MREVDLADMLISLYRTNIKCKQWYLNIIFYCLDICKVNTWLLYKRHFKQLGTIRKKELTLLDFINQIFEHLLQFGTSSSSNKVGCPKRSSTQNNTAAKSGRPAPLPVTTVQYDATHHWPHHGKKNRSHHCSTGYSRIYCERVPVFERESKLFQSV